MGHELIVRTGMTEVLEEPTPANFATLQDPQLTGIDGTKSVAKWLWDHHFAAVASDKIPLEALPPLE